MDPASGLTRISDLPLLFRPVPFGCSTIFLCTIAGAFLGPSLFQPAPTPEGLDEVCGNGVIAALFGGGGAGLLAGMIAAPFVGWALRPRARPAARAGPDPDGWGEAK